MEEPENREKWSLKRSAFRGLAAARQAGLAMDLDQSNVHLQGCCGARLDLFVVHRESQPVFPSRYCSCRRNWLAANWASWMVERMGFEVGQQWHKKRETARRDSISSLAGDRSRKNAEGARSLICCWSWLFTRRELSMRGRR